MRLRAGLRAHGAAALALLLDAARLAAAPVPSEGPLGFDSYLLRLPGKVHLTWYEDIDRDGLTDVLAVVAGPTREIPPRDLVVYRQRADGFPEQPDLRLRIPDRIAALDLGDVIEAAPGQELLMLDGGGIWWVSLSSTAASVPDSVPDSAPDSAAGVQALSEGAARLDSTATATDAASSEPGRLLAAVDPLLAHSDVEKLAKYDFARSIDKATRATLLIPRTEGYRVFYPDDDYAQGVDIAARHVHRVGDQGEYRVRPAPVRLADFDGDGHEDLALTHLDDVAVHLQRGERFNVIPDLQQALRILTDVDRESPDRVEESIDFKLADFDNDKLADIFVWKTVIQKKAVIHDKQQYQLYRNKNGRFETVPDQAFVLKSFDAATVSDLDGDGRLDLVTGYFEPSVGNIIKALLTKKFAIDLSFFLADEAGFPDQPAETRDVKIRFSLSNLDETFAPAVEVEKDFDGNGVVDFLLQTEDQRLEVFLGAKGKGQLFEKKASVKLKTPACNNLHVDDMNGDGRADMAFDRFPEREPFQVNWINVLISRR